MVYAHIETKKKKKKRSRKNEERRTSKKRSGDEKHHHTAHRFRDRVAEQENAQNNDWRFLRKVKNEKRRSFKSRLKTTGNQRETQ